MTGPEPDKEEESQPILGHEDVPIPTYEEATSSHAPTEFGGYEPESTRLLQSAQTRSDRYRPPTVESVRSSLESSFLDEFASDGGRTSEQSLRREIIQMEVMNDGRENGGNGAGGRLSNAISKRLSSIWSSSSRLAAISLPSNPFRGFSIRMPSIPSPPCCEHISSAALVPIYRLGAVLFGLMVVYVVLATDVFSFRKSLGGEYLGPFDPKSVRTFANKNVDKEKIKHWLEYLTSFDHLAGTQGDYVLAKYIQSEFATFGFDTQKIEYNVYLNYPKPGGRRVWMDDPKWEAELEEPSVDPKHENTLSFHGHSKSGTAKGPLIYANYGSSDDFRFLEKQKITLKGSIVLIRNGGIQYDVAVKVKAAENMGAAGVLLFSDPKTEGWDWPEKAVQRDSVSLKSRVLGDVLTPGWPSLPGFNRITKENNKALVNIPSLPLSYKDARQLLNSIRGKGKKVDEKWVGGVPEVSEYWTGSSDSSPVVTIRNNQVEQNLQPIWNIMGTIPGFDQLSEKVIFGSHRDAWCFGASDPNSGTAIMLEVARVFGEMMKFGWRPRRSIVFANWDAATYNLIGSTEFVEDAGPGLREDAIVYVNLDAAITGTNFTAAGSPGMQSTIAEVLSQVNDPITNDTLDSMWTRDSLSGLSAKGDYAAFQHYAGISSIDLSFSGKGYPSHSCYDNFEWMKTVGDPTFEYHETLTKIISFLLLDLADSAIIPLNMTDYGYALHKQVHDLESWVLKRKGKIDGSSGKKPRLDIRPLFKAVSTARGFIERFQAMDEGWMKKDDDGVYIFTDEWSIVQRRARSLRMGDFENHLLDLGKGGGLPGRELFKHTFMGPQAWNGNEVSYFPGIRDAVENNDLVGAQKEIYKVSRIIERAARKLLNESS